MADIIALLKTLSGNGNKGKIGLMRRINWILILLICVFGLTACYNAISAPIIEPPGSPPNLNPPPSNPAPAIPTPTPTLLPPTPTPQPLHLTATVWPELPKVPVLMYHRFFPQAGAVSFNYTTSIADFDGHIKALYDAGFSLVSLSDWLRGEIHLPEGRRPLIITIDDLFYADQLSLTETSQPAPYSGVGHLWQFYQAHPDFNFHVALFFNLGDKGYANQYYNGVFTVGDGWRQDQAEAIAWGIENGAMPYNHFYEHPFLDTLSPDQILWQLEENDRALREALALVGKQDYAKGLPNILALPYVIWPATEAGKQVLYDYLTPEGAPVLAIMEGGYPSSKMFLNAPYAPEFNRWHVPRMPASWQAINTIIENADQIPAAMQCDLGEFSNGINTSPGEISTVILARNRDQTCPDGYYIVQQWAFKMINGEIIQLTP